jgi:hypothetical protein
MKKLILGIILLLTLMLLVLNVYAGGPHKRTHYYHHKIIRPYTPCVPYVCYPIPPALPVYRPLPPPGGVCKIIGIPVRLLETIPYVLFGN